MNISLKKAIGAIIFDAPRYLFHFIVDSKNETPSWVNIRNRQEKLVSHAEYKGVKCDWQWTSDLYLPKLFPVFGKKLFQRAFTNYPISLSELNESAVKENPQVSFIIGHRGLDRIPLLLKTLESIAGQKNCDIECIVVEQDNCQLVKDLLPDWVNYVFTPIPEPNLPYSRSWAFNEGSKHANAECIIFHDNDLVIPDCFAYEVLKMYRLGFDFINLKRFIFYLTKDSTARFLNDGASFNTLELETIMQNAEGGGSIGASKKGFEDIGKFDQRFVGWGGEDNEFWDRAQTKNICPYTFLPLIHLWHIAQPEKKVLERSTSESLYNKLNKVPAEERIKYLKESG